MLLDSNPHLLSAKTQDYPLSYWGIMIKFIQISYNTTISSALYEDSRRLSKRSLNIHMSRVNFGKQYHLLKEKKYTHIHSLLISTDTFCYWSKCYQTQPPLLLMKYTFQ